MYYIITTYIHKFSTLTATRISIRTIKYSSTVKPELSVLIRSRPIVRMVTVPHRTKVNMYYINVMYLCV